MLYFDAIICEPMMWIRCKTKSNNRLFNMDLNEWMALYLNLFNPIILSRYQIQLFLSNSTFSSGNPTAWGLQSTQHPVRKWNMRMHTTALEGLFDVFNSIYHSYDFARGKFNYVPRSAGCTALWWWLTQVVWYSDSWPLVWATVCPQTAITRSLCSV